MEKPDDALDVLPARLRPPKVDPAAVRRRYRLGLITVVVCAAGALTVLAAAPVTTIATQDRADGAWLEVVEGGFRGTTRRELRRADAAKVATTPVLAPDANGMLARMPLVGVTGRGGEVFAVHVAEPEGDAALVAALERWLADPKAGFTTTRPNKDTRQARRFAALLGILGFLGACLAWMARGLLRQLEAAQASPASQ